MTSDLDSDTVPQVEEPEKTQKSGPHLEVLRRFFCWTPVSGFYTLCGIRKKIFLLSLVAVGLGTLGGNHKTLLSLIDGMTFISIAVY